jgi:hypothetical protein
MEFQIGFLIKNIIKSSIFYIYRIFIYMRHKIEDKDKKVKLSITISPKINKKMEDNLINKSKLIEKLLNEYYGNK